MTDHHLVLEITYGICAPRLTCTAPPDAPCRHYPPDDDLPPAPGQQCWAQAWVEAQGFDGFDLDGPIPAIPVNVTGQGEDRGPLLAAWRDGSPAVGVTATKRRDIYPTTGRGSQEPGVEISIAGP